MRQRFFHKEFNPAFSHEDTKKAVRNYLFDGTNLKKFKGVINNLN